MAALSGTLMTSLDGSGASGPDDYPLIGWTARLIDHAGHFGPAGATLVEAVTNASGVFALALDDAWIGQDGTFRIPHSNEWYITAGTDNSTTTISDFDQQNAWFTPRCRRVGFSRWITKICYIPGVGVKITFKGRHGPATFVYPSLTQADADFLYNSGAPGHWLLTLYKGTAYYRTATSP